MTEPTDLSAGLMQFPMEFPIKIVGLNTAEYEPEITRIVREHAPDWDDTNIEARPSSAGKYLALTVTIEAQSREQLDNLYRALTSHPLVRVVL
jgi:putative lipoic acid-binding regulatory protein